MRTSYAQGAPPESTRNGYRIIRRAGRYLVFPRAVGAELAGRHGQRDGLVEIWNGVPWLTPLWARGPRVAWLHHVHGQMWSMVLPPRLARLGEVTERRLAPPTLPPYPRRHLVGVLPARTDRRSPSRPGSRHRRPAGHRPPFPPRRPPRRPASGRGRRPADARQTLRRAHRCRRADVRQRVPGTQLVIVGEGAERERLEDRVAELDAAEWVRLPGRLGDAELVELYRRAWVLASASVAEGWGMTITEAAACGTPSVVTDIAGHRDAVVDHETGELCRPRRPRRPPSAPCSAIRRRRERLGAAALAAGRGVHLGGDGGRHPGRPRRRGHPQDGSLRIAEPVRSPATESQPRAPEPRGRGALVLLALAAVAYVPLLWSSPGEVERGHQAVPLPRPRALVAKAPTVGPDRGHGHGHAPDHRLPVADGALLLAHAAPRPPRLGRRAALAGHAPLRRRRRRRVPLRTFGPAAARRSSWRPSPTCCRRTCSTTPLGSR